MLSIYIQIYIYIYIYIYMHFRIYIYIYIYIMNVLAVRMSWARYRMHIHGPTHRGVSRDGYGVTVYSIASQNQSHN